MSVPTNRLPPEGQRQLIELLGEFARNTMSTSQLATMTDMEHKVGPDPAAGVAPNLGVLWAQLVHMEQTANLYCARSKFSRK